MLEHGYQVKAVEVTGCLHLKSAICALDEETVLVNRRWINLERVRGLELVDVHEDEPWAANCLAIGGAVALARAFPRTAERVAAKGYVVSPLDVAEMAKAAGVRRFLFASSCSIYGAAGDEPVDEDAPRAPLKASATPSAPH